MRRALIVTWGKRSAAQEGAEGRKVLPGSEVARTLGCICPIPSMLESRAAVVIDTDCPAPRYRWHDSPHHTSKQVIGSRWDVAKWHYHQVPWS